MEKNLLLNFLLFAFRFPSVHNLKCWAYKKESLINPMFKDAFFFEFMNENLNFFHLFEASNRDIFCSFNSEKFLPICLNFKSLPLDG